MGLGGLGMWEMILIFMVVLLLFGAKRLPEIGSSLGKGIREFKGSIREIEREVQSVADLPGESGTTTSSGDDEKEPRTLHTVPPDSDSDEEPRTLHTAPPDADSYEEDPDA